MLESLKYYWWQMIDSNETSIVSQWEDANVFI